MICRPERNAGAAEAADRELVAERAEIDSVVPRGRRERDVDEGAVRRRGEVVQVLRAAALRAGRGRAGVTEALTVEHRRERDAPRGAESVDEDPERVLVRRADARGQAR